MLQVLLALAFFAHGWLFLFPPAAVVAPASARAATTASGAVPLAGCVGPNGSAGRAVAACNVATTCGTVRRLGARLRPPPVVMGMLERAVRELGDV